MLIRYEGPRGGPGMQEMLYPTSYLKSKGLGKACALVTDGRFSGGSSGLSIGHVSPEAAEGGAIGLVREGDLIEIDISAPLDPPRGERGGAGAAARGAGPAGLEAGPSAAAEGDPGAEGLCRLRHLRGAWCRARSRGAGVVSAQASHHQRIATTVAMPTAMSPALAKQDRTPKLGPPRLATMPALTTVLLRAARVMAVAATVTEFVRGIVRHRQGDGVDIGETGQSRERIDAAAGEVELGQLDHQEHGGEQERRTSRQRSG